MESNMQNEVDHFCKNRGQDDVAHTEADDNGDEGGDEDDGGTSAEDDDDDDMAKSDEVSINGTHTVGRVTDDVDGGNNCMSASVVKETKEGAEDDV
ncbi:hypothetical protein LOK49_LG04G03071 [Camellia lanceoleosa]|uniref:Uncharacterized protein n=1 Tax=Camellia lanceoleosa TaxID=1840588 RepID=A0ACC0I328_9ERIC|nr:hypothetical protein LOK49_LG04G03071 [Camellia lanceoleosa]